MKRFNSWKLLKCLLVCSHRLIGHVRANCESLARWLCIIACITAWSIWSSTDDHRGVFTLSREIPIVLWLTIIGGRTSQWAFAHECQILKLTIQHTSREELKINCRCEQHFHKIILWKYVSVLYHMRIIKCMVFYNFPIWSLNLMAPLN